MKGIEDTTPRNMQSFLKSKNQGRIYQESTCKGFLKVDFIMVTAAK